MMRLLDAATVAAAARGQLAAVLRLGELQPRQVAVSALSRMELEVALALDDEAAAAYREWIQAFLSAVTVLAFGEDEVTQAVRLAVWLERRQLSVPLDILQLAATALAHGCTLVSTAPAAYADIPGLSLECWTTA